MTRGFRRSILFSVESALILRLGARKEIAVPLNGDALRIITLQIGKHPVRVFSYKGETVTQVTTAAWYKALKRCGIEDFRWHDLRHT